MKYRVTIRVSFYTAFFEFDDINDAASFMATAVKKLAGAEDDKTVTIGMVALKEEEDEETN